VDNDAAREGWISKYKVWILIALGLAFAVAAGFMLKAPSAAKSGETPVGPGGALQALRDEMFSLETDRLGGKLSESEYQELKAAYDLVLKRALGRTSVVEVVTE
jgi:hypothetical protein